MTSLLLELHLKIFWEKLEGNMSECQTQLVLCRSVSLVKHINVVVLFYVFYS